MKILTFRFWMIKCLTHKLAEGYSEAAQATCEGGVKRRAFQPKSC